MTIIEAFQKAENGHLITNNFLKLNDCFLKYVERGIFYQYKLNDDGGKPIFIYTVTQFTIAEIISIGWEVVENKWFLAEKDEL